MTTWGMIGLGEMGLPMARNLVAGGVTVGGWDLDERAREAARQAGVTVDAPAGLAGSCDVIGVCVRDEAQAADAVDALGPGNRLLVLHSTIGRGGSRRIAARAEALGHRLLDAPVSGMAMRAQAGTLTFLVGGDEADLELARPGLDAMGERIFHLGEIGAGQVAKLANNLASLSTVMVVMEAVELGVRAGVPEEQLLEVHFTTGRSYLFHHVPAATAQAFGEARIKGRHFNAHIRGRYRFSELTDETQPA